ncbi:MAG: hypothetical protein C7B46_20030 [Sulfobacillus benefaciens]|uniref:Uncharacterized protein n=1 Tax=Sulfobacillus benefaciens TaxID=453960 RepID=A0A2T2WVV4_9FIRM|nr:MAG: hypothetical protein C7B46_20030 [Sulfobacillus benefaciens]
MAQRWEPDHILRKMQEVGQTQGTWLTMEEWMWAGYRPTALVILRHFHHWREAWKLAGFDPPPWTRNRRGRGAWDRDRVIQALQQAAQPDGTIMSEQQWNRDHYLPNRHTIQRYWGTYEAAVAAAGLTIQHSVSAPKKKRQQWLADWQRLSDEIGHPATRADWEAWPDHPEKSIVVWRALGWPTGKYLRSRSPSICQQLATVGVDAIADPTIRAWAAAFCQGTMTLDELARQSGLTREGVRQRIIRAVQHVSAEESNAVVGIGS